MAIILFCQICFMSYGMWTVFASRPVIMAFTGKSFYMVKANEIEKKALKQAQLKQFQHLPLSGPEFVGTREPDDINVRNDIVFAGAGGMGIQNLPQYYVPLADVQSQIIANAKTTKQLDKIDPEDKKFLEQYEKSHSSTPVAFLNLFYKGFSLFVVVNSQTGKIIEII